MPLYFKTTIRQSSINGTGIIALEDIPEGATYWTFEEEGNSIVPENCPNYNENLLLTEDDFKRMTDENNIRKVLHESFFDSTCNLVVYLRDGTEMTNHSENPNSFTVFEENGDPKKMKMIATRLIKAGEELTDNYNGWHPRDALPWYIKLVEKYYPESLAFYDSIKSENTMYSEKN